MMDCRWSTHMFSSASDFLLKEERSKRMVMATWVWTSSFHLKLDEGEPLKLSARSQGASITSSARYRRFLPVVRCRKSYLGCRIYCKTDHYGNKQPESNGIQLYTQIERLFTYSSDVYILCIHYLVIGFKLKTCIAWQIISFESNLRFASHLLIGQGYNANLVM